MNNLKDYNTESKYQRITFYQDYLCGSRNYDKLIIFKYFTSDSKITSGILIVLLLLTYQLVIFDCIETRKFLYFVEIGLICYY